jgi:hypothetical protein
MALRQGKAQGLSWFQLQVVALALMVDEMKRNPRFHIADDS